MWADGTDGTSNPTPKEIISHITTNFTHNQLASVQQLSSPSDIPAACPQNFNLFSQCFAALAFTNIPADGNASNPINYTIFGDAGLALIDVIHHTSDFEKRMMPLQWAIDRVIFIFMSSLINIDC
jgi:ATP-binding cassette subfamily A (ABC1) protein 3